MQSKTWNRGGRPTNDERRRRKALFLSLIADGHTAPDAAKRVGLNPWVALEVVTESSFNEIVQAIRAGDLGPTAVRTADAESDSLAA